MVPISKHLKEQKIRLYVAQSFGKNLLQTFSNHLGLLNRLCVNAISESLPYSSFDEIHRQ